jgi:hypothetical protein
MDSQSSNTGYESSGFVQMDELTGAVDYAVYWNSSIDIVGYDISETADGNYIFSGFTEYVVIVLEIHVHTVADDL